MKFTEQASILLHMVKYNFKVVFAGKFVYFLIAALIFYLVVLGIMLFSNANPDVADLYITLLFPGILILFYPVVYNIQNDKDARMLEIIFGVPDYRYKVYLFRVILTLFLVFICLSAFAGIANTTVVFIPVFELVFQLMFPLVFIICLTFLFSTIIRNGNGTAAIMVVIGLALWFLGLALEASKWNLFLNPFRQNGKLNQTVWDTIVRQNRIILCIGSVISFLWGMLNLQRREKFVQ